MTTPRSAIHTLRQLITVILSILLLPFTLIVVTAKRLLERRTKREYRREDEYR